jgi:hypothetical protein
VTRTLDWNPALASPVLSWSCDRRGQPWEGALIDYYSLIALRFNASFTYTYVSDGARARTPNYWTATAYEVSRGGAPSTDRIVGPRTLSQNAHSCQLHSPTALASWTALASSPHLWTALADLPRARVSASGRSRRLGRRCDVAHSATARDDFILRTASQRPILPVREAVQWRDVLAAGRLDVT